MSKAKTKKKKKGAQQTAKAAQKPDTFYLVLSRFFGISAVVLLVIGGFLTWRSWHANNVANHKAAQAVYEANHNINHSVPATIKPSQVDISNYHVPADQPRYIEIPKLAVKAIVRPLGLTSAGQLEAPTNVFDTGWYTGSAKPGQIGATVIDGHVSSWTTKGVFYAIKTLKSGDIITIVRGDDSLINYRVTGTQIYDANNVDMNAVLSPSDITKPSLNLITCTGTVAPGTSEFTQRVVVFSQQI